MWCIVGCDPDVGGALAVITGHDVGVVDTVRIFDCPTQTVMFNRRPRKRACVDGMVKLVRELNLPAGTVAHVEVGGGRSAYNAQTCFVQGAASGQWIGVLKSHDFDVRLVAASTWKWALKLACRGQVRDKNDSRDLAKRLFGDVADVDDLLRRQKDHAQTKAGPTVMRLATARASDWGAAKLRSKSKSGRSGRSGPSRTAGRMAAFFSD